MLDRNVTIEMGPAYPQKVTQKLAPTAEHMRLLREYEEAAKASVISRTTVDSNDVKGEVIVFQNQAEQGREVIVRVVVNGREVQARTILKDQTRCTLAPAECLALVRETLGRAMVDMLVVDARVVKP